MLNSLGAAPSKALKLRTMDWAAKSGEVKLQDFFYPFGVVGSSVEGVQMTWDYFKEVLNNEASDQSNHCLECYILEVKIGKGQSIVDGCADHQLCCPVQHG